MEKLVPLALAGCRFLFPKAKSFLESEGWTDLLSFKCLFLSHECQEPASSPTSAPTVYTTLQQP